MTSVLIDNYYINNKLNYNYIIYNCGYHTKHMIYMPSNNKLYEVNIIKTIPTPRKEAYKYTYTNYILDL